MKIKYKKIKVDKFQDIPKKGAYCVKFNDNIVKLWRVDDKLHREDGPAAIWYNKDKYYYIEGKEYKENFYWKKLYKLGKITQEELFLKML